MYKAFLIKYGEIGLKGKNRHLFVAALADKIRIALDKIGGDFEVTTEQGRIYAEAGTDFDYDEAVGALSKVFGVVAVCPVVICESKQWDDLCRTAADYIESAYPGGDISIKVFARRADKSYPKNSMEIAADMGEYLLDHFPAMHVDVHHPEVSLNIEIRDRCFIYSMSVPGPGGMPVGTNGAATVLLSGGIDSPVAAYMIAKRGVKIDAVYFHAPPYTSERAKEKVIDLASAVASYAGPIQLNIVNFTDIQMAIYDRCPHDELTIIMRRYMMRIAEKIALEEGSMGLVTGESVGQVASQTMQSLMTTDAVCTLPVYRPLIGFDKNDIVELAEKIGTFDISIRPYEDCCTIFVAKHPVTKPILRSIEQSEHHLADISDELTETALKTRQIITCG